MRVSRKDRVQSPPIVTADNYANKHTPDGVKKDAVVEMPESEYLQKFNIKTETFKEQACMVLNLLESRGVDIYSEDNTPGMYLRQKGQQHSPAGIRNMFRRKSANNANPEGDVPIELKNFFKSKNK